MPLHISYLNDGKGHLDHGSDIVEALIELYGVAYATDIVEQGWDVAKANEAGGNIDQAAAEHRAVQATPLVTFWATLPDGQRVASRIHEAEVHSAFVLATAVGAWDLAVEYDPDPDADQAHFAALAAEWEYDDSQRLDELATAEDYNRFEENLLAEEAAYERDDDEQEQADLANDEGWLGE